MTMWAKEMNRAYLEHLGITNITPDGRVFVGEKEVKQYLNSGYMRISFYDPDLYKVNGCGQVLLSVHKVIYTWFVGICPAGKVIDHIDGNKLNNSIGNLQLITQKENLAKAQTKFRVLKADKRRNKQFYLDKLEKYTALYEDAKARGDQKEAHKQRANLSNTNAKLRNFD